MSKGVCCFVGHRSIEVTDELKESLYSTLERLITEEGFSVFLFGSKSQFNNLCLVTATALKEKYPHIKRVFVRAEYPDISEDYLNYLLSVYEETYYPEKLRSAGRAVYVERNREMIDKSDACVIYYDESRILAQNRKSGARLAYEYAVKKGKRIIRIN